MFEKALPIFPKGKANEMNVFALFKNSQPSLDKATLYITAHYFYKLYINGKFVFFGPARAAKGYARVDEIDLSDYGKNGINEIEIIVAGYSCSSLSTTRYPSFLQAEIRRGEEVLAATGYDFDAYIDNQHVQKVERYSFQRHFTEIWDLTKAIEKKEEIEVIPQPILLNRHVPQPDFSVYEAEQCSAYGSFVFDSSLEYSNHFYSENMAPHPEWGRFDDDEIIYHPHSFIQRQRQIKEKEEQSLPITLEKGKYAFIDLKKVKTGFVFLEIESLIGSEIVVGFSEFISGKDFSFTAMHAHNAIGYFTPNGKYELESFEPYVARYLIVMVMEGKISLNKIGIRAYSHQTKMLSIPDFNGDKMLQSIYRGAVNTFAHNAVDIYTDCPSRERGGWLCDSFFTAKVEHALFNESLVEDNFLQNYALFDGDPNLPSGMIPMVYPSDIIWSSKHIPQWSMWYILEIADYLKNRNHTLNKEDFRKSIDGLLDYYSKFENSDGLLSKLPSWNFVEWSKANEWTQDVNYPTNFLYSALLCECASLFNRPELEKKAKKIRETAIKQSFNGKYFVDHAVENADGSISVLTDASEACQYYAILFAGIDIFDKKYDYIRNQILTNFGAERKVQMPEIAEINAFVGAYLRLEVLLKMEQNELVIKDIKEFFGEMEKATGTLWEYRQPGHGSQDHGFASYAAVALLKAFYNK